jgi:pheromone A receptor
MPNRYDIYEDFGPMFNTVDMVPAYFCFHGWPVAIGLVSFTYCCEYMVRLFFPLPRLIGHSQDSLHILQAPMSVQRNIVVYPRP